MFRHHKAVQGIRDKIKKNLDIPLLSLLSIFPLPCCFPLFSFSSCKEASLHFHFLNGVCVRDKEI